MPSLLRRTLVLGLAVLAMAATGCSKDKTTKPTVPTLTQEQADDLVQQVAMMTATDHGGWLIDIQTTLASVPMEAPPGPLARRLHLMPASAGPMFRALADSDTVFVRAGMTYHFKNLYSDTSSRDSALWFPGVTKVEVHSQALGTITATGFTGAFKHDGDPVTLDWFDVGADTVTCSGVGDDSLFTTFTPALGSGTKYYNSTAFVDFDFLTRRDPSVNPWPVAGSANSFLFADVLRTPNPADYSSTIEGTVTILFDGTQNPLVGVTNEFEGTTFLYRYHLNLQTGAFSRAP
jgi:hypothetical protein